MLIFGIQNYSMEVKLKHWDILLSNKIAKKDFITQLLNGKTKGKLELFNTKNGILFSDLAIEAYIEKEAQYDKLETGLNANRKLQTFSSGERKKTFLAYCVSQKPDFIVLDNPLDHLDLTSRKELVEHLKRLSQQMALIQLVNRAEDLLPFIANKAQINDNSFTLFPIVRPVFPVSAFNSNQIPPALNPTSYDAEELVKMNGISVSYNDRPILSNINWTIKKGDFWQLVGPNGSGKSTILSLISGDNPKGYGQDLHLFGRKKGSGESIWDIKKHIGFFATAMMDMFQTNQTVEQMLLSGFFDSIGLYKVSSTAQQKVVQEWLDLIQMSALKNSPFKQLSIGEQRVILILRAILKHPPLLILDEPVEGLDDENTHFVIQLIHFIAKKTSIAIIFVSHRVEPLLLPKAIYELKLSKKGSTGKVLLPI